MWYVWWKNKYQNVIKISKCVYWSCLGRVKFHNLHHCGDMLMTSMEWKWKAKATCMRRKIKDSQFYSFHAKVVSRKAYSEVERWMLMIIGYRSTLAACLPCHSILWTTILTLIIMSCHSTNNTGEMRWVKQQQNKWNIMWNVRGTPHESEIMKWLVTSSLCNYL